MVDSTGASSQQQLHIRKVTRDDVPAVSRLLARAFDDDPFITYLVKQDARRFERMTSLMRLVLTNYTMNLEETYVTEGFEGAASWNAPSRRPGGLLTDLRGLPSLVSATGFGGVGQAIRALDLLEQEHPKAPHYYLEIIGVEPEHQGKGIGSQLMASVLSRADQEGAPAYLENSKERNLPLYERHGFRVTKELHLPKGGPTVWLMWREPN